MNKVNNKTKPLVIIQCYEDRLQSSPLKKTGTTHSDTTNLNHHHTKGEATDNPPPPPPMPTTNGQQNCSNKMNDTDHQQNISKLLNDLKAPNCRKNGTLTRTPTPDYNEKSNSVQLRRVKDEKAELESLESYKLKHPSSMPPKPPSNYFVKAPNGTATMKKHARPVSVTIGEYAHNGNSRREPTKLEFLNGDRVDGFNEVNDVPITNRLQSELALTLSRSNLRKKTEALGIDFCTLYNEDSECSLDKSFHARYGNNLLPLPPSISIPKVLPKIKKINMK